MKAFPILEPTEIPIAAFKSAIHPLVLQPGEMAMVKNLRWGDSICPQVRAGTTQLFGVADASVVSIIDTWGGELNGNQIYAAAAVCSQGAVISVTGATIASPTVLHAPAHGLVTGQWVVASGFTGLTLVDSTGMQVDGTPNNGVIGLWQVSVVDTDHVILNNSTAAGAFGGAPTIQVVKTRIFASVNNGALSEITSEGNSCRFGAATPNASTRFPNLQSYIALTGGSVGGVANCGSTQVSFCAVRTPNGLESGTAVASRDVLVISNGIDSPRIWDPLGGAGLQMSVHDSLSLPSKAADLTGFSSLSTFNTYLQVAGLTGKTYDYPVSALLNLYSIFGMAESQTALFNVFAATAATPCQLTVTAHGFSTGTFVTTKLPGLSGVDGTFQITVINANVFTLNGTTATGAYTGGGVCWGPGAVQISNATAASPIVVTTLSAHKFANGDQIFVSGAQGLEGVNGYWAITVVSSTTFQLVGSTGTGAYTSGGLCSYSRYTGTSSVPTLILRPQTTPTNQQAAVQFTTPITVASQLIAVVEGPDPITLLSYCKVEVSPDNTATHLATNWYTAYDPTSTGIAASFASYQYQDPVPAVTPARSSGSLNPAQNRFLVAFAAGSLPINQVVRHIRFTYLGPTTSPDITLTLSLLMAASAGQFAGTTEWVISYEDEYSRSESFGIEAANVTSATLGSVGGPPIISTVIPPIESIKFDYVLTVPSTNVGGGVLSGGLAKNPTAVCVYIRLPSQTKALYAFKIQMLEPIVSGGVAGWAQVGGTAQAFFNIQTASNSFFTQGAGDPTRESPSAYQIAIPPSSSMIYASSRLVVGDVYNSQLGVRSPSDVYISSASQPFRMATVPVDAQGNYDAAAGTRATFVGEQVVALVASSSMAEAASYIYVFTTTALHMLGGGGIMGALTDSNSLGTPHRIGSVGTQCPRSVVERNGVIVWVDNEYCVRRMYGGVPVDISRRKVNNLVIAVTPQQRQNVQGCWTRDRYYLLLGNGSILVWHEPSQEWESLDVPPAQYTRMVTLYNPVSSGSGRTLMATATDKKTYGHEVGTTDLGSGVAISILGREMNFGDGSAGVVKETRSITDPVANGQFTVTYYYRPYNSVYVSTLPLTTGYGTDSMSARTEITPPANGDGELGTSVQIGIDGTLPCFTSIISLIAQVEPVSTVESSSE